MGTRNGNTEQQQVRAAQSEANGLPLTALTDAEARSLPKPFTGFEQWGEPLSELFRDYAAELGSGGVDLALLRESLAAYDALDAAHVEAQKRLALIDDTRLLHASKAWEIILIIYRRAQIAARTNQEIGRAVEAFEKWMRRPRKKAPVVAPPSTT